MPVYVVIGVALVAGIVTFSFCAWVMHSFGKDSMPWLSDRPTNDEDAARRWDIIWATTRVSNWLEAVCISVAICGALLTAILAVLILK